MTKQIISQSRLKELLHYDPDTGIFTWIAPQRGVTVGMAAGSKRRDGYIAMIVEGYRDLLHRMVFIYMTGKKPANEVDHIDHNKANNRWNNLREVTHSENQKNMKLHAKNTSGINGVCWHRKTKTWNVCLTHNGKKHSRGYYKNIKDAEKVRNQLVIDLGFHENHGV